MSFHAYPNSGYLKRENPEGVADHRQGWSTAEPLSGIQRGRKPRRGDRTGHRANILQMMYSVTPSGFVD